MRIKTVALLFLAIATNVLAVDIKFQADRWMPINGRPDENPPGYAIEILVAAFTDTDNMTYTLEPWKLVLENTKSGECDGAIGAAADEAEGLIVPKEPIGHLEYGLWTQKGKNTDYTPAKLKTAKIGIIEGYTYWPELDELIKAKSPNLRVFTGDEPLTEAIEALRKGEIDFLPEATSVFVWALREKKIDIDAFEARHVFDSGDLFIVFHKSETGQFLANKWDRRITELRKSGKLAEILAKYHTKDWAAPAKN